jgi:hypothetical protein
LARKKATGRCGWSLLNDKYALKRSYSKCFYSLSRNDKYQPWDLWWF